MAAKLASGALVGAAMGTLSVAVSAAVAIPWLRSSAVPVHVDAATTTVAVGLVLSTSLYGALGG